MTRTARRAALAALFLPSLLSAVRAQDSPSPAEAAPAQDPEQEMERLRARLDRLEAGKTNGERSLFSGWQLQLRGGWFTLAHNHRRSVFARSDSQHGWSAAAAFVFPLWPDLGPIDLCGHLSVDFRQLRYSPDFAAPITGAQGTANYLNVIAGPLLRLNVHEVVRPFVFLGASMQVASPPKDPITYLDLGFAMGLGVDLRVHERVSLGLDYRYTWFGVADQEDEDYGALAVYVGFNF